MFKRIALSVVVAVPFVATPAFAQARAEASLFIGYTFADGVSGQNVPAQDGNVYNRIDPKDSFSWGFDVGVHVGEKGRVGFIYGHQSTQLEASGTNTRTIGDEGINTYHGFFEYDFGESDAMLRPYVMVGLGATSFGDVTFTPLGGATRTISGVTRFSTTWAGGVKAFPSPRFGVRAGLRWTPAYIKSDAAGWWCDPFWGCYVVGNSQYANQFDINGGVIVRF